MKKSTTIIAGLGFCLLIGCSLLASVSSKTTDPALISDSRDLPIEQVHQSTYDSLLKNFFDDLWNSWKVGMNIPHGLQTYLNFLNQFSEK